MANKNQPIRVIPTNGVMTVRNYGVSDIAEGLCVKMDTSNTGDSTHPPGVVITSSDANPIGVTTQVIKASGNGVIQIMGRTWATASGTIHVGDTLMTDSAGKVLDQTAGKYQVGIAVSEAVSSDPCEFVIAIAKNA